MDATKPIASIGHSACRTTEANPEVPGGDPLGDGGGEIVPIEASGDLDQIADEQVGA